MRHIDNVFLLNLPERSDRLSFQKKQLESIWNKVNVINPLLINNSGNFQNKATRSCFISHIKILRHLMSLNYINKINLILEDDAIIFNINALDDFIYNVLIDNQKWDMIYLYKRYSVVKFCKSKYDVVNSCLGTYGYIVNPSSLFNIYNKLRYRYLEIKYSNKKIIVPSHIDQALKAHIHPHLNIVTPKINLVHHDDTRFSSDIGWKENIIN